MALRPGTTLGPSVAAKIGEAGMGDVRSTRMKAWSCTTALATSNPRGANTPARRGCEFRDNRLVLPPPATTRDSRE